MPTCPDCGKQYPDAGSPFLTYHLRPGACIPVLRARAEATEHHLEVCEGQLEEQMAQCDAHCKEADSRAARYREALTAIADKRIPRAGQLGGSLVAGEMQEIAICALAADKGGESDAGNR